MSRLRAITLVVSYILLALYLATAISTIYYIIRLTKQKKEMEGARSIIIKGNISFIPSLISIMSTCSVLMTLLLLVGVHKKIHEFIVFWLFYCISNTLILLAVFIFDLVVSEHIDVVSTTLHWTALILQICAFGILSKYSKQLKTEHPN